MITFEGHPRTTKVSWGFAQAGGDTSAVRGRLRDVRQIQSSESAFAETVAATVAKCNTS